MKTIPGVMDAAAMAALFGERPEAADQHRPRDRRQFRVAIQDMLQRGMTERDVALVLNLSIGGVRELRDEATRQREEPDQWKARPPIHRRKRKVIQPMAKP